MITNQYIKGKKIAPDSKSQMDISVLATFDNDSVQANISTDSFEYILEAYQEIKNHIDAGKIFEPLDYKIEASDGSNQATPFEGFIKLYDDHTIDIEQRQITAKIEKKDGLNNLYDQLNALDYAFLELKGLITESNYIDWEYTIEKQESIIDKLFITAQLISVIISSIENAYKLQEAIASFAGILAAGVSGSVGAAIYAGIQVLAITAYQVLLGLQLYKLVSEIYQTYAKPKRIAKAMTLYDLMAIPLSYLGYSFNTTIPELYKYALVPSNTYTDERGVKGFISKPRGPEKGYPNIRDAGYSCLEMFSIIRDRVFGGKIAIINGVVEFHAENSPFWVKQSTYKMRDKIQDPYRYNTNEAKAIINVKFATDSFDFYNIEEYQGTTYSVFLESFGDVNNIKDREELSIPWALASRKDSLNFFEVFLREFFTTVDQILSIFQINSNFSKQYKNKIGVMKVSDNNWTLPKLVYNEGGKMPANHRDLLSAKALWNNYLNSKSFIQNDYWKQRLIYEGVSVPFTLEDFINVVNNSYFYTQDGRIAKVLKIEWTINKDRATLDFWVQNKYTDRLIESYYEAE